MVGVVDLDAPHRNRRDWCYGDDEPAANAGVRTRQSLSPQLPLEPEYGQLCGFEPHPVAGAAVDATKGCAVLSQARCEPQTCDQFQNAERELFAGGDVLGMPEVVDVAVGVHQPLQQREPLLNGCGQVWLGYVLASEHTQSAQLRLEREGPVRIPPDAPSGQIGQGCR